MEERSTLFALGGNNEAYYLSSVQEYSLPKNIWKAHSPLSEGILISSAVVVKDCLKWAMYNIVDTLLSLCSAVRPRLQDSIRVEGSSLIQDHDSKDIMPHKHL